MEQVMDLEQVMEQELRNAAIKGDVGFLSPLDKDDPRLLKFFYCNPVGAETPLHVALLHGHPEFSTKILKLSPELARMPNKRGTYPLHLASARGYVDVVKELLEIDPSLSCLRDKEGRTALASAALNKNVEVLELLYPVYKKQVELRNALGNEREELILHICVEHELLEMAKVLVKLDMELLKKRDDNDNTALHLAAGKKNTQMLEFLKGKMQNTDVKIRNKQGLTAANIEKGQYTRAKWRLNMFTSNSWDDWYKKDEKWTNEMHNTLILLATLIVTVAFQAGVNPPGGFWSEEGQNLSLAASSAPHPRTAGTAIHNNVRKFRLFMYFDLIAFAASLTTILSLVSGFPLRHRFTTWMLVISVWIALTSMAMAFVFGTEIIIVNEEVLDKIPYVLGTWMGLMAIVLLCHCVILVGLLVEKIKQGGKLLKLGCRRMFGCNNTGTPSEREALKKDEECGKH